MRLSELEAKLIWQVNVETGSFRTDEPPCPSLAEAQGLLFLCPKCFKDNNGPVGTHSVICWFEGRGIPDDMEPRPGRWTPRGTSIEDITFVPAKKSNSVLLLGGCNWHGFITNGDAT